MATPDPPRTSPKYKYRIAHVRKDSFCVEGLSRDVTIDKELLESIEKSNRCDFSWVRVCPKHGTIQARFVTKAGRQLTLTGLTRELDKQPTLTSFGRGIGKKPK